MDLKSSIVAVTIVGLVLLFIKHKRSLILPFVIALGISLAWTSYYPYDYVAGNILLFNKINIYPLVLWTVGLTFMYVTYMHMPKRLRLLATIILYFFLLAAVEAVGYHYLNIRLASNYTSLLGLGVIHAPFSMKIFYVLAGPLYIFLIHFIHTRRDRGTGGTGINLV